MRLASVEDTLSKWHMCLLPQDLISKYWKAIGDLLQQVPDTWEGYSVEAFFDLAMHDKIQVWAIEYETKIRMVVFTQLVDFPTMKQLQIIWCGGQGILQHIQHLVDTTLDAFARSQGCTSIAIFGRPGWKKFAQPRGFKEAGIILTRPVYPERKH